MHVNDIGLIEPRAGAPIVIGLVRRHSSKSVRQPRRRYVGRPDAIPSPWMLCGTQDGGSTRGRPERIEAYDVDRGRWWHIRKRRTQAA